MPTYKLEAIRFRCIDESGAGWTGSDEPCFRLHHVPGAVPGTAQHGALVGVREDRLGRHAELWRQSRTCQVAASSHRVDATHEVRTIIDSATAELVS